MAACGMVAVAALIVLWTDASGSTCPKFEGPGFFSNASFHTTWHTDEMDFLAMQGLRAICVCHNFVAIKFGRKLMPTF